MTSDFKQQQECGDMCEKMLAEDGPSLAAIENSKSKVCGICFDIVVEKEPPSDRKFGLLDKCSHVFCFSCIGKWRNVIPEPLCLGYSVETCVTKACPECRVHANFITPSSYWIDNEEEKQNFMEAHKKSMSTKPCKYFREGKGICPAAEGCLYLHAYPDGTKASLPPRSQETCIDEIDASERTFFYDFFDSTEEWMMQLDMENLSFTVSDNEDMSLDLDEFSPLLF